MGGVGVVACLCRLLHGVWHVVCTTQGEEGLDWGGLSRDATVRAVEDCFSAPPTGRAHLNLFLPVPNAATAAGSTRPSADRFLPHPRYSRGGAAARYEGLYQFVGRLLGHSLRHKQYLPFMLPPLAWKALVGQEVTLDDVAQVDETCAATIRAVANAAAAAGATAASFAAAVAGVRMVVTAGDGSTVDLMPEGGDTAVTLASASQYVKLATAYKVHEYDHPLSAMAQGLFQVVPERAVKMCSWSELELLVCGDPHIDVDVLQAHTEYSQYSRSDRAIRYFWEVMRGLTDAERSRFIRFAYGRSRLPRGSAWERPFRISRRAGGDDQLPISHSCFFHIELPSYSTLEIARRRLLAAIHFGLDAYLIA